MNNTEPQSCCCYCMSARKHELFVSVEAWIFRSLGSEKMYASQNTNAEMEEARDIQGGNIGVHKMCRCEYGDPGLNLAWG